MEIKFDGGKAISAHIGGHIIKTDQPIEGGGQNSAPNPFQLFLASIGTCVGFFVKSFLDQREISAEGIKITQNNKFDEQTGLATDISFEITLPTDFPDKYIPALIAVAEQCKVKKSIAAQPNFKVTSSKI